MLTTTTRLQEATETKKEAKFEYINIKEVIYDFSHDAQNRTYNGS